MLAIKIIHHQSLYQINFFSLKKQILVHGHQDKRKKDRAAFSNSISSATTVATCLTLISLPGIYLIDFDLLSFEFESCKHLLNK